MSHVEWDQNVCSLGLNFRKNSFHCVTCPFYSNCWKMIKIRICLRKIKINETYAIAQTYVLVSRICSQHIWYFHHVLCSEISTMTYYVFYNLLIIQKVVTVRCRNPILRLMWFLVSCMKRINWLRTIFFSA